MSGDETGTEQKENALPEGGEREENKMLNEMKMTEMNEQEMKKVDGCGFERRLTNRIRKICEIVDWTGLWESTVNIFVPESIQKLIGDEEDEKNRIDYFDMGGPDIVSILDQ